MRKASKTAKRAKNFSRRTLSMILAGAILVTMIVGVLSGILTNPKNEVVAENPVTTNGLNRSVLVQQINLLPVDPDVSGSRTTLYAGTNSKQSGDYSDIIVNEDGSVDFTITQNNTHNKTSTNNTSFVEAFTLIGQKINLAENPWLMVRWSGSGRCNGRIYFSVTYNGTEYGNKNKSLNGTTYTDANGVIKEDLKSKTQQQLISSGALFQLPLSNIINNNNAGYNYVNQTQTDFNAGTVADYSIDLYKYISDQVANGSISLGSSHWPKGEDWLDASKYYVTMYMSCQIIASESNQQLTAGTSIHWDQFAIGREVLNRPASLLPRNPEFMNITETDGATASDAGRVSKLDDGSVTFLNTSASEPVMFEWHLRRYFNATELEALHINAAYSGNKVQNNFTLQAEFGGTTAYKYKPLAGDPSPVDANGFASATTYSYRGLEKDLQDFIYYSSSQYVKSSIVTDQNCEVVVDFNEYLKNVAADSTTYPAKYSRFYPEDSLVFIKNLKLTLPAGCKITFTRLEFQVENEDIPATQADTVYPWVSATKPNGLPPKGTPAVSTALDGAGISYDWATAPENAPIVKTKIDLLAMKTYSWELWDEKTVLSKSDGDSAGVAYIRKTDGSSIYSSSTIRKDANGNSIAAPTQNSYYTIMRYGPDSNSENWNRNFYTYFDVNPAHTTTRTPYLYYSYELVDTTPNDGVEAQAGFYFHFRNSAKDRYVEYANGTATGNQPYCYQYYLDHSGIALNECSSVWSLGYASSVSGDVSAYEYGAKAILSNTKERTGCIDISSLWVDGASNRSGILNGEYLQLESLRIYLAPGTEIKMNYFFIGSESLDQSVIDSGTLPREGGEAFPWSVTKADFDKWTSPDSTSKKFTFANKVDLIKDIQDRAKVNGQTSAFPGATVDSETGAVTVTVSDYKNVNEGYLKKAGFGFDHHFQIQVAGNNDYASMRYLNYSVDAPAGMRWSIMFCEHPGSSTDQYAIMTWCDADARFNDNDIMTAPPAGKSLFRMATANGYYSDAEVEAGKKTEYHTYWDKKHNTSWRIYSIPGSQTGCVDLRQVDAEFEWNNIVSIYLVAYQDPNLVLEANEQPSVTFNYLYLTSTPIEADATTGVSAKTPGTIYNWGNIEVIEPNVNTSKKHFTYSNAENWTSTYALNYKLSDTTVDLTSSGTPYLYYSYRLIDKSDPNNPKLAKLASTESLVSMWVIEQNTYYYQRSTSGYDSNASSAVGAMGGTNSGYGKPSFIRRSTSSSNTGGSGYTRAEYYGYAAETGCINLADYFTDDTTTLNQIRLVVNNALYQTGKYEMVVDYLFLGGAATSSAPNFEQTYTPLDLEEAPHPSAYQDKVMNSGTAISATTYSPVTTTIDLDKTPYLFYCVGYASGNRGTFSLSTSQTSDISTITFFRDASRTDGGLISQGTPTVPDKHYMFQSESGCIDVRGWYIKNGIFDEDDAKIIDISSIKFYGASGTVHYMYFAAEADKTIDLLPSQAGGRLDNGLPTRTWVVTWDQLNGSNAFSELSASSGEWDTYNDATNITDYNDGEKYQVHEDYASMTKDTFPTTQIKHKEDVTNDNYNDLWIKAKDWSQIYIRYGNIINMGGTDKKGKLVVKYANGATEDLLHTFKYCTTGNNQMSGLMIDLNETPYLHFSFEQPATSKTAMVLQTTNNTATSAMNGQTANKTRPWLSAFYPSSNAGQLTTILASTNILTFYKDTHEEDLPKICTVYGEQGGVIDLRSWYSQTNGYGNIVSLDSVRFYTYAHEGDTPTELKINHLYLSSSSSAAYAVTFHKNDGSDTAYTQYVLQNANKQYVDDTAVAGFKSRNDGNYVFVGWYTDESCEQYFDIAGTPLTGNIHLYARWINTDNTLTGEEINLLANIDFAKREALTGNISDIPSDAFSDESLRLEAKSGDLTVRFPIGKSYSIEQFRALFMGFDIDKTCDKFDIILEAKCASSYEYSLVQDVFRPDFMTSNGNLTAAPYDRELAFYTYLGVNDDLPTVENEGNLIEINAITFVIPKGVSVEVRYVKASKELALQGKTDARAPAVGTGSFDLLKKAENDNTFVNKGENVVYTELAAKSLTYQNAQYTQAAIHAVDASHVHLGGLYNYTIDMNDSSTSNPGRYLYFSFDQPEDSYVTFALYTSFSGMVEGNNGTVRDVAVSDIYTKKAVSYYSATAKGLAAKEYGTATEAFVPVETAFVNGNVVGKIDLYEWYKDALQPYRQNSEVDAVKLLGVRFFTSNKSTDVNINYFFIGADETKLSKEQHVSFVESAYRSGAGAKHVEADGTEVPNVLSDKYHRLGKFQRGETLYVTLDQLTNLFDDVPINDPTAAFSGWVFRDIASEAFANTYWKNGTAANYEAGLEIALAKRYTSEELMPYVVWWNPNATNGNMYIPEVNEGGAWYVKNRLGDCELYLDANGNEVLYSVIDQMIPSDFVTDRKSIFYTFSTNVGNTQVIIPIFETNNMPTLTVDVSLMSGMTGSVEIANNNSSIVSVGTNQWQAPFATDVVVRANGSDFVGWYDDKGVVVSTSRDYHVSLIENTKLVAQFGYATPDIERLPQSGKTIVWLQSEYGKAGTDFYLKSIKTGQSGNTQHHIATGNIDDLTGNTQIICYWNLNDSQVLTAVAPAGYHWEQLLSDGASIRVTSGNEYTFIASTNVKLIAVKNSGTYKTTVMIDEFAFDDNRNDPILRFNGQVNCAVGEEVVSCGIVFANHQNHGEIPSVDCAISSTVTATAWNSTTGQFVVEFSIENSPAYVVRGYAVIRTFDSVENKYEYSVRYSDCVATVF